MIRWCWQAYLEGSESYKGFCNDDVDDNGGGGDGSGYKVTWNTDKAATKNNILKILSVLYKKRKYCSKIILFVYGMKNDCSQTRLAGCPLSLQEHVKIGSLVRSFHGALSHLPLDLVGAFLPYRRPSLGSFSSISLVPGRLENISLTPPYKTTSLQSRTGSG